MKTKRPLIFQIEPSDYYSWFFESVVGLELAARRLRHTFYSRFGYLPELPEVINQREVIASELDRKGRVSQELRAWGNAFIETKTKRWTRVAYGGVGIFRHYGRGASVSLLYW
jgi:hypothetical protein